MTFHDTINQGADYELTVLDKLPDGSATDLTGCTARLQARRTVDENDPPAVDLTSTPAAGLAISEVDGRIDVHLTAEQTKALSGTYLVQLEVTWPGGRVDRLLDGKWTVSAEVVR
jgi:hypothetical protein